MKVFIILCAVWGSTCSAPLGGYGQFSALPLQYIAQPILTQVPVSAPIVTGNLHHTLDTLGQYKFTYSSTDGQAKTEHRQSDGGVSGQFSYMSPEGKPISLSYIADKDGFRPVGDHLPVAPEVPPMPADLVAAYKQSNDRLARAYEEARLRGDTEVEIPSYETYVQKIPITYAVPQKSIVYFSAPKAEAIPSASVIPLKSGYAFNYGY